MSRGRRRRGVGAALLGVAVLLAVAVGGVVLLLRSIEVERPFSATCVASDGEARALLDPDQAATAAMIAGIGVERGLPARAVTIALATAMQESRIRNIDYGDRDSVGIFQQRPSQGWGTVEQIMDPVYSTNAFYDALVEIDGYLDMEITDAAQAVQRSAFPEAYAQHEQMARLFASALTGWSDAALICHLHDGDVADTPTAVADAAARDFPTAVVTAGDDGTVTLSGRVTDDDTRSAWALAHWAVSTAESTGVDEVTIGSLTWSRADGRDAAWVTAETPAPDGTVVLR